MKTNTAIRTSSEFQKITWEGGGQKGGGRGGTEEERGGGEEGTGAKEENVCAT